MTELSGPGGTPSPGSAQGPMYEHFHLNLPNNLRSPKGVLEGLKASHKRDVHAKIAYNTLALCAGTVFGVFSALALTGIMVNPVGLAVSGSLIALALAIAGGHGGMKEVLSASRIALAGFAAGAAVVLSRFTMKFHTFGGYDPAILLSSFLLVGGLASFSSGIYGATVPPPVLRESGLLTNSRASEVYSGIKIHSLKKGESLATEEGGILVNDIILQCDGRGADDINSLKRYIESSNKNIKLKVWRDNKAIDIVLDVAAFDKKKAKVDRAVSGSEEAQANDARPPPYHLPDAPPPYPLP